MLRDHTAAHAQEEPAEDKEVARPASSGSQPPAAAAAAAKPKPAASAASRPTFLGSASSASASASASAAAPKMNIDWKGDLAEQCRDAIKNGDSAAVALLLERGQVFGIIGLLICRRIRVHIFST